jgi:hypothetical protein
MKWKLTFLLTLSLAAGSESLRADVDMGRPVGSTSYDQYLGPVRQVFAKFGSTKASISEVRTNLRTARRFRYYFNDAQPYTPQLPAVTEARREGDCKAKSLWLASKVGDRDTRYVIGNIKKGSKIAHAWLLWSSNGTWYALDPTNKSEPLDAERIAGKRLIPRFSYTGSNRYQHPSFDLYVN